MKTIQVYIPGKVMLAGEYSVLRGGHALAATLNYGMTVNVTWDPRAAFWEIYSNLWQEPKIIHDDHTPQTDILCRAVQFAAKKTGMHGGRVTIDSDLDISFGVGSSSALRLGVCGAFFALQKWNDIKDNDCLPREALTSAWQLQSEAQGLASGYDIVTQFVGGLVEFNFDYAANRWEPHWFKHHVDGLSKITHVFVGGRGAPTTTTMQTTGSWLDTAGRLDRLLDVSESLVDSFNAYIHSPDRGSFQRLVSSCAASRALFAGNPHFPTDLAQALSDISGLDRNWSWKTTGAGGEDAILVVAMDKDLKTITNQLALSGWHPMGARFSDDGAKILKIASDIKAPSHTHDLGVKSASKNPTDGVATHFEANH